MTNEKILAAIRAELEDYQGIVAKLLKERKIVADDRDDLRMRLIQTLEHLQAARAQCMVLAQKLENIERERK